MNPAKNREKQNTSLAVVILKTLQKKHLKTKNCFLKFFTILLMPRF
jgi:hypothetical protein